MLSILLLIMAAVLYRGMSFCLPRSRAAPGHRHRTRLLASPAGLRRHIMSALSTPATGELEYQVLGELASRVVQGHIERAVPTGTQLRRRRAWDLFLDAPGGAAGAAILVVNKKSTFTLEDARVALGIMDDEARSIQQLLLATRSGVAPAAEAFLKGAQATRSLSSGDSRGEAAGVFAIMRWERLRQLVQDGDLGRHLAASSSRRRDGSSAPTAPSFALPAWLLEERGRGTSAVFDLHSPFEPAGDQPEAIKALSRGLEEGKRHQTLLGATGTGKTFIVANVIKEARKPTLVLAPNKVLASQLTNELRALFPNNAVEFFVSYYDYYLPEAFNSASDTYIDKVVQINDDIDRMRHSATRSLLERRDVIVVASVCQSPLEAQTVAMLLAPSNRG